jgi:hypothetical protein
VALGFKVSAGKGRYLLNQGAFADNKGTFYAQLGALA